MGRGGYNGGGPSVNEPKSDNTYIFTGSGNLDANLLGCSLILKAGQGLKNEHGAVQREFGYIIEVGPTKTSEHSPKISLVKKVIAAIWVTRKARAESNSDIRWVAASELLDTVPKGTDLVSNYHSKYPNAPQPWGYKQKAHSSGTQSKSSGTTD
jgi:hypothetical protein